MSQDAELLEASTKRNDKYAVRRILDVHYIHFRFTSSTHEPHACEETMSTNEKMTSIYFKNNPIDLPAIFFNILHLAIEHNAMDVLRICLKYGLDPNRAGTTHETVNFLEKNENFNHQANKSIRYFVECQYCLKKKAKTISANNVNSIHNNPKFLNFLSSLKQISTTSNNSNNINNNNNSNSLSNNETINNQCENTKRSKSLNEEVNSNFPIQQVNYSSYSYLIRYPPLFLSISKCNHAATDLLLTYGVCANIQDDLGKKKAFSLYFIAKNILSGGFF